MNVRHQEVPSNRVQLESLDPAVREFILALTEANEELIIETQGQPIATLVRSPLGANTWSPSQDTQRRALIRRQYDGEQLSANELDELRQLQRDFSIEHIANNPYSLEQILQGQTEQAHPLKVADQNILISWNKHKNRRRCELILKKHTAGLSTDEATELEHLQIEQEQYTKQVAPLPTQEIQALVHHLRETQDTK